MRSLLSWLVLLLALGPKPSEATPRQAYLNRCAGGCEVGRGPDDAGANQASVIQRSGRVEAFALGDAAWQALVACVQRHYAPFGIELTDVDPGAVPHLELMIGGHPEALGMGAQTSGLAPWAVDCHPLEQGVGFVFVEAHADKSVPTLCETAAHELGHMLGLEHATWCGDLMSYQRCGAKYFTNRASACGEFGAARPCRCGATQNAYASLGQAVGHSVAPPAPTVEVALLPDGVTLAVTTHASRPVPWVQLWFNGTLMHELEMVEGAAQLPLQWPPGRLRIEARALDDLRQQGVATLELERGAACVDAQACWPAQQCAAGACRYDTPVGTLGAQCETSGACESGVCFDSGDGGQCSSYCTLGDASSCDAGFRCVEAGGGGKCARLTEGCCNARLDGTTALQRYWLPWGLWWLGRRRRKGVAATAGAA